MRNARSWHVVVGVVVSAGLLLELILVTSGASVLITDRSPGLGERLFHLVSYFTIQSNALVLLTTVLLIRRPRIDTWWFRVLRLDALVGIVVTGVVHLLLLRPLLTLTGWSYVGDLLVHVVSPILMLVGWLVFGPRPRIDGRTFGLAFVWPALWLVGTLITGAVSAWYPYPFLDAGTLGAAQVAVTCLGVTAVIAVLAALAWWADRRLSPR